MPLGSIKHASAFGLEATSQPVGSEMIEDPLQSDSEKSDSLGSPHPKPAAEKRTTGVNMGLSEELLQKQVQFETQIKEREIGIQVLGAFVGLL